MKKTVFQLLNMQKIQFGTNLALYILKTLKNNQYEMFNQQHPSKRTSKWKKFIGNCSISQNEIQNCNQ